MSFLGPSSVTYSPPSLDPLDFEGRTLDVLCVVNIRYAASLAPHAAFPDRLQKVPALNGLCVVAMLHSASHHIGRWMCYASLTFSAGAEYAIR
ncbi:hypothetical protein PUNSTDRAFT_131752 [Punctularia strigosozonata HHB-11173 SS5]|uniref:uncharacterized protein n=1 Tax=Punctularia strigosozonata (strain HHB-11173) TaxID=741275 RepID=UPI0004416B6F|nr:uncharacterized protein PUNSTDRAFT_131752 [Punctularia strigosozonata HHB-11173 SS5]EIN11592.1 hypothetical protein PUNSTDRAFT_131752 [Punctularia strigosozonata HHB-11173 SS5]